MKIFPWPKRFCPQSGECEWNGFLSPKQMKTIDESIEYVDWCEKEWNNGEPYSIWYLLEKNPFLVSSILKDAGEKSKEENK